jgi:thymidylate synthase (FAD)
MLLINPYYIFLSSFDRDTTLKNIERAGRTCYKSENKITETSASDFVNMLIRRGHESALEHEKLTVKFVCDRGVSHELVRHRIASFSQESTHYCNYGKTIEGITFIIPSWIRANNEAEVLETCRERPAVKAWYDALQNCENAYLTLIDAGWPPQHARTVLPNSLKTEIVVTANIREWRLILKQRTAGQAHPQMQQLMRPFLKDLTKHLPELFKDITYEQ